MIVIGRNPGADGGCLARRSTQISTMSQDNSKNYHVEEEDSEDKHFKCNLCQYKAKKESTIKSHMTQKHKAKDDQQTQGNEVVVLDDVLDDDVEEDMRLMAEWNRPDAEVKEVTPENEDIINKDTEVAVINEAIGQEGNLGQAVERRKVLEEDLSVKEELIKKMESELETARELANIATAKEASLEDEKATLKGQMDFFRRVGKAQMEDINKMKAGAPDPGAERSMKEAEDKIKNHKKTIDALEKNKKELAKKMEEEVCARGKAEADASKFSKMVDLLQQGEANRRETPERSTIKCRDVGRAGGCPRAGRCPYLHPALEKENKNIDCHHWMAGRCKFPNEGCRFKHDPKKKDSKANKKKTSEEREPTKETSQTDFLLGLVKTLVQGPAGVMRLEGQDRSSQGLESQKNANQGMGGLVNSSRELEGHHWDQRSYPSRTWGQDGQERSRSFFSPGPPAQELEGLRGLVQGPKSAPGMDRMQEGIQLLMQLAAQEAGRR